MTARDYAQQASTKKTPQSQPVPGKEMAQNTAGGYAFEIDDWARLIRFLILGNEGGTYYASQKKLTLENAVVVNRCLDQDPEKTIKMIVNISQEGRAPKNDPAIFALAIAAGRGGAVGNLALHRMHEVCRIGTHLFDFLASVESFRGWGRSLKKSVEDWYLRKTSRDMAYQVTKYQQRGGWSHRDVLRLAHPVAVGHSEKAELFGYITSGEYNENLLEESGPLISAVEEAKQAESSQVIANLIKDYGLVRECIPTKWLNDKAVWQALLEKMPLTAMVRSLGKMASVGLLTPMSKSSIFVQEKLRSEESIKKSRIHPIQILMASSIYRRGHGLRGSLTWDPDDGVCNALDEAFYTAFGNLLPLDKRVVIGVDISGSMGHGSIAGTFLRPREAAAAMAMVFVRLAKHSFIRGFSHQFVDLKITSNDSLNDVIKKTRSATFGGTDCSLPMIHALEKGIEADVFVVLTDNETWYGRIHPCQALEEYRRKMGIPAKLVVVGMTATQFSIADPNDPGMMDVVGFDTAAPQLMHDFVS